MGFFSKKSKIGKGAGLGQSEPISDFLRGFNLKIREKTRTDQTPPNQQKDKIFKTKQKSEPGLDPPTHLRAPLRLLDH